MCIAGAVNSTVCYLLLDKLFRLKSFEHKSLNIRLLGSDEIAISVLQGLNYGLIFVFRLQLIVCFSHLCMSFFKQ